MGTGTQSDRGVFDQEVLEHLLISPAHETVSPGISILDAGSTASSVFNMCSATLGAGALALPFTFAKSGWVLNLVMMACATLLTIYSIRLLIRSGGRAQLNSYEDLALHCFGPLWAKMFEVTIAVFCFGICVAYVVAAASVLQPGLEAWLGPDLFLTNRHTVIFGTVICFMLPLSLVKNLSSLRYASLFGIISIFFVVFAVGFRSAVHIAEVGEISPTAVPIEFGWDIFLAIPIIMFAFTSQTNVFQIYEELRSPSPSRMSSVVNLSVMITLGLYLIVGLLGYFHFGSDTEADILHNYAETDPVFIFARICVLLTVTVAFPFNVAPCRFAIEKMLYRGSSPSRFRSVLLTLLVVLSVMFLSLFIPGIDVAFGLLGAVCSSIVCFVFPGAFFLKLFPDAPFYEKVGAMLLVLAGIFLGIVSTVVSIWDVVY